MDMIARKKALLMSMLAPAPSGLPSEYLKVQYLESTGTQYIDTGVVGKPKIEVTSIFEYTNNADLSNSGLLGSRQNTGNQRFYLLSAYNNKWHMGIATDNNSSVTCYKNVKYSTVVYVDSSSYYLKVDGATIISLNNSYTTSYNLYLFACNNIGTPARYTSAKVYSMQIKMDDALVRDFVPCVRISDGKPGMYDLVGQQFYTNAGTGEFIAGLAPDLSDTDFWGINGYFVGNGSITLDNGYRMCDYMPIVAGNEYKISTSNAVWNGIGFYNESYTPVDFAQNNAGTVSKTAPANAKYYRIYTTASAQGVKFELVNPT